MYVKTPAVSLSTLYTRFLAKTTEKRRKNDGKTTGKRRNNALLGFRV
jgi:hypothetical protein